MPYLNMFSSAGVDVVPIQEVAEAYQQQHRHGEAQESGVGNHDRGHEGHRHVTLCDVITAIYWGKKTTT